MKESEAKVYDDFIEANHLVAKTQLSQETLRRIIKKAMMANSFAYILSDVVNSFIMDCDECLGKFDKAFSFESKKWFNEMRSHIIAAKKCSEKLCQPMYHTTRTDDMCADSDWWLALIKLVDDRVSDDYPKTQQFLELLLNMPEGDSPYKVTFDDFKLFKD